MRYAVALLGLGLCLMACTSDAPPATDSGDNEKAMTTPGVKPDFTIKPGEGFGILKREMNRAVLEQAVGKSKVIDLDFYLGEGETAPGLALYPETPEEVEVLLDDDGFVILYRIAQKGGKWATSDGLKVGSTVAELVAANGGHFKFMGFDWDYGGSVTNWEGGHFDGADFLVKLGYNHEGIPMTDEDAQALLGDQEVVSDLPAIQRYEIMVVEIMQRY